jgi:putative cell wall-binding protein
MRVTARAVIAALLVGLVGLAPGRPAPARAAVADARSEAKVVIVVGAVHGSTSSYRERGQEIYDEAVKWSKNVVKIFSPNATWAAVKAAAQGANVFVYLGHGNGFPSPYRSAPWPYSQNGMGLNASAGNGDYNNQYYGEYYIGNEIRFARNAVVLLTGLCYAAGNSEPGYPEPSVDVAMQRADNYAAGFLRAGAGAVLVENAGGDVRPYIRELITGHASLVEMWLRHPSAHGNEFSFPSIRTTGARVFMDPSSETGPFKRALSGDPNLRSEQVTGVAAQRTDGDPDTLVAPGKAEVAAGGADAFWDAALTDDSGTAWPAGTRLEVEELSYGPDPGDGSPPPLVSARVREVDDPWWWSIWVDAADLLPRDSAGPHVADLDGPHTLTPNGDGDDDSLALTLALSEPADWTAELRTPDGEVLFTDSGHGESVALTWDGRIGDQPAPPGAYRWEVRASDDWGNDELEAGGLVSIDAEIVRIAGVSDRYQTAAAISAATFKPGVAVAYVATGLDYPTDIPGAAAAGFKKAPLLLVTRDAVPAATAAELTRLAPGRIIVLGPRSEVGDAVATALAAYASGGVGRIGGADRYAVAANISAKTFKAGVPIAYIATGTNFPDALAGSAAGAVRGGPVLFVDPASPTLPAATAAELARLRPQAIAALGGTAVVPDALLTQLAAYTSGSVSRLIYGGDRYGTAVAVSRATFPDGADNVYIATGLNFPDALAAATMAGRKPGPVLLVTASGVPAVTAAELFRLDPSRVVILGGSGVVNDWVKAALRAYASR